MMIKPKMKGIHGLMRNYEQEYDRIIEEEEQEEIIQPKPKKKKSQLDLAIEKLSKQESKITKKKR